MQVHAGFRLDRFRVGVVEGGTHYRVGDVDGGPGDAEDEQVGFIEFAAGFAGEGAGVFVSLVGGTFTDEK